MAKYNINYSCGHKGTVGLVGKYSERERKIEWMEQGVCPDCYKAQQEAKRAAENKAAAVAAADAGLPALKGSEKQINWANSIRADLITGLEKIRALAIEANQPQAIVGTIDAIINNGSAKFWIDNRGYTPKQIVTMEVKKNG
ncbi:MAG: hypothetical protein ACOX8W_10885 [bacterium]|jgi:hypothetical protein